MHVQRAQAGHRPKEAVHGREAHRLYGQHEGLPQGNVAHPVAYEGGGHGPGSNLGRVKLGDDEGRNGPCPQGKGEDVEQRAANSDGGRVSLSVS